MSVFCASVPAVGFGAEARSGASDHRVTFAIALGVVVFGVVVLMLMLGRAALREERAYAASGNP